MTSRLDITGERYGRLVAIKRVEKSRPTKWLFKCDCGKEKYIGLDCVRGGRTNSCGCLRSLRQITHGHSVKKSSKTYNSWAAMKARIINKKNMDYVNYGGRGITICDEWINSFEAFISDMGERPKGKTLDRIDNNKGYYPENCRWSTASQQAINKRPKKSVTSKYKGVIKRNDCNTFRARVTYKGKRFDLGGFTNEIEAAKAYDKAAKELHGEFAYLNFPDEV